MTAGQDLKTAVRRVLLAVLGVILLAGCRLDVAVDIVVDDDGSGTITAVAVADAELVERVPNIADELALDDVVAAGWVVDGPTPTAEGGLSLTITHDFRDDQEATNLLRSLGPPFRNPELGRGQDGDTANNTLKVNFGLPEGFASFADDDLVNAIGSVPFADEFEAGGFTPENSFGAVLELTLPGELIGDETNADADAEGVLRWTMPVEGIDEVSARSTQEPSQGRAWARPVSWIALIALIAWVATMTLFIGYVALARWRRSRRYRRRGLPLAERRQL